MWLSGWRWRVCFFWFRHPCSSGHRDIKVKDIQALKYRHLLEGRLAIITACDPDYDEETGGWLLAHGHLGLKRKGRNREREQNSQSNIRWGIFPIFGSIRVGVGSAVDLSSFLSGIVQFIGREQKREAAPTVVRSDRLWATAPSRRNVMEGASAQAAAEDLDLASAGSRGLTRMRGWQHWEQT